MQIRMGADALRGRRREVNNVKDSVRAKERVEALKTALAKAITSVCAANDLFKYECECENWGPDVGIEIEDGLRIFGVALADLTRWYEDEEGGAK